MKHLVTLIAVLFSLQSFSNDTSYQMKLGEPMPMNLFSELAKKINPAVVSISISLNYHNQMPYGQNGGQYRDPFFDLFEQFMQPQQQMPQEVLPQAVGTGFIIDPSGLVLTNFHVIEQANTVSIHLNGTNGVDGEKFEGKIMGGDKRTDIALVKITSKRTNFPVVTLGDSKNVQVGDWVSAFGNPFGHEFSMSKGIISAIGRRIRDLNAIPFIQTDASINPGNSGGPLVNTKGEVIGVNAAIDARAQGIGFAIPIDHVKSILPQLKQFGKVLRGFIGVQMGNITRQAQTALKLPDAKGALIIGVQPGGSADKAGLKPYDVIKKFGDATVESADDLLDAVKDAPLGKKADVELYRSGKKLSFAVNIEEPPKEPAKITKRASKQIEDKADVAPFKLGFKMVDFSDQVAKDLKLQKVAAKGPVIVEVSPDSPAAQNGLRVGDIVLDVNQAPVKAVKDVMKSLSQGSNVLRVVHGDQVSLVFIEI